MITFAAIRRNVLARLTALALLASAGGMAHAAAFGFDLLNNTNQPIVAMWASPAGYGNWGRPFDNTFVPNGGHQRVTVLHAHNCIYDLRVQFSQGQVNYWRGVDLCSLRGFRVYAQYGQVKGFMY